MLFIIEQVQGVFLKDFEILRFLLITFKVSLDKILNINSKKFKIGRLTLSIYYPFFKNLTFSEHQMKLILHNFFRKR